MRVGLLASYWHLGEPNRKALVARKLNQIAAGWPVVLDSGAFSAKSSGARIPLLEYARFAKAHRHLFDWVASLDVIGDPVQTRSNWTMLLGSVPDIVPCVHFGTDPAEIDWYRDNGATRIAFGGLVPHAKQLRFKDSEGRKWLDSAFVRAGGVRIHGFGVTGYRAVLDYPWTSVDSSTISQSAMRRQIIVFDGSSIRTAKDGDLSAEQMQYMMDPFESVKSRQNRNRRIAFNATQMESAFHGSGLEVLYHAVAPDSGDAAAVRRLH